MIRANTRGRLTAADLQLVILLLSRGSAHRRASHERRLATEGPDPLLDAPELLERLLTVRIDAGPVGGVVLLRRRAACAPERRRRRPGAGRLPVGPAARLRPARPRLADRLARRPAAPLPGGHPGGPRGERRRPPLPGHGAPRQLRALAGRPLSRLYRGATPPQSGTRRHATTTRSAAAASAWRRTTRWPSEYGLGDVLRTAAERFPSVRSALNGVSDRLLFPSACIAGPDPAGSRGALGSTLPARPPPPARGTARAPAPPLPRASPPGATAPPAARAPPPAVSTASINPSSLQPARDQPPGQPVHRLVMKRVHAERSRARARGPPGCPSGAAPRGPRSRAPPGSWATGAGPLRREILIQRAAHGDVDQLDARGRCPGSGSSRWRAAANSASSNRSRSRLGGYESGDGSAPYQAGWMSSPPGEQQAIGAVERPHGAMTAPISGRQDDGHAARAQHRAHVGRVHAGPLGAVPGPDHAADGDPGRAHGSTESGKKGQRGSSMRGGVQLNADERHRLGAADSTVPIGGAPSTGPPS